MKLKIEVEIPSEYKWLCRQPFGTITAFIDKPSIVTDVEFHCVEDEFNIEYWGVRKNELEVSTLGEQGGDWKNSLVAINQ